MVNYHGIFITLALVCNCLLQSNQHVYVIQILHGIWIRVAGSGFERMLYPNERGGSASSKGKADLLALAPKWFLACGGQI